MGYCTDERGRLVCDSCGNVGNVRKRTCIYKVLGDNLRSPQRYAMAYCYPPAYCPACYASKGGARGVHGDQCRDGAARIQREDDARQARLDAGDWHVVSATGDWHADVPTGMVAVTFGTAGGREAGERRLIVPGADYDDSPTKWLSDYLRLFGRRAFEAGKPAAPALSAEVMAAIDGLPVGAGAAQIMRWYLEGWNAASLDDALQTWMREYDE